VTVWRPTYQVVAFLGVDSAGKGRYVRKTAQGSKSDAGGDREPPTALFRGGADRRVRP